MNNNTITYSPTTEVLSQHDYFRRKQFVFPTSSRCLGKVSDCLIIARGKINCDFSEMTHRPENINELMISLADVVIMAHAYAKTQGIDFDDVIINRTRNNIERLDRALNVAEIAGCSIECAWETTKRRNDLDKKPLALTEKP